LAKTSSATFGEAYRLRVLENRALKSIFGPTREKITDYCRKLQYKELHVLYFLLNTIRAIE
jgi:hypothetical protein